MTVVFSQPDPNPHIVYPMEMILTASSMGILINKGVTSRLTSDLSLPTEASLIVSAKCLEFRTCELVLPATGEMMEDICTWKAGTKRGIQ